MNVVTNMYMNQFPRLIFPLSFPEYQYSYTNSASLTTQTTSLTELTILEFIQRLHTASITSYKYIGVVISIQQHMLPFQHTALALSAETSGVCIARETCNTAIGFTLVVAINTVIVRKAVTVGPNVITNTMNSESQ